jgi:hypothetical protein
MKVIDLIHHLSKFDGDCEVHIQTGQSCNKNISIHHLKTDAIILKKKHTVKSKKKKS